MNHQYWIARWCSVLASILLLLQSASAEPLVVEFRFTETDPINKRLYIEVENFPDSTPQGTIDTLVTAIVMEIAEDWQTADKRYITFTD